VGCIITLKISKRLKRAFKTLRAKGEKIMDNTKKLIELLKKHNEVAENLCFAISEPAGCTVCPYYDENTEECEVETLQCETERAIGESE
jgi:hypothetical protein